MGRHREPLLADSQLDVALHGSSQFGLEVSTLARLYNKTSYTALARPLAQALDTHRNVEFARHYQALYDAVTTPGKLLEKSFEADLKCKGEGRTGPTSRENPADRDEVDTRVGTDLLPTIYQLLVIARQKASVTDILGYQIACAEIPPSLVQIVEIKPLYCQRIQCKNIHLEEASRNTGGPAALENDNDAIFQATATGCRLVLTASNTVLDCFHKNGVPAAIIFLEVMGSDNKSGDLGHRYLRVPDRLCRDSSVCCADRRDQAFVLPAHPVQEHSSRGGLREPRWVQFTGEWQRCRLPSHCLSPPSRSRSLQYCTRLVLSEGYSSCHDFYGNHGKRQQVWRLG